MYAVDGDLHSAFRILALTGTLGQEAYEFIIIFNAGACYFLDLQIMVVIFAALEFLFCAVSEI